MRFTPALKGLITAILMIITAVVIDQQRNHTDPRIQYVIFFIYAAGIIWSVLAFAQSGKGTGKFAQLFGQGFRCFIIVTICMVIFTFIFIKMHPEFAVLEAQHQREELVKLKDKTPLEIEDMVSTVKKQYTLRYLSASIFGYLIIGAGISAAISALLTRRK